MILLSHCGGFRRDIKQTPAEWVRIVQQMQSYQINATLIRLRPELNRSDQNLVSLLLLLIYQIL